MELSERLLRLAERFLWVMRSVTLASKVVAMAEGNLTARAAWSCPDAVSETFFTRF